MEWRKKINNWLNWVAFRWHQSRVCPLHKWLRSRAELRNIFLLSSSFNSNLIYRLYIIGSTCILHLLKLDLYNFFLLSQYEIAWLYNDFAVDYSFFASRSKTGEWVKMKFSVSVNDLRERVSDWELCTLRQFIFFFKVFPEMKSNQVTFIKDNVTEILIWVTSSKDFGEAFLAIFMI